MTAARHLAASAVPPPVPPPRRRRTGATDPDRAAATLLAATLHAITPIGSTAPLAALAAVLIPLGDRLGRVPSRPARDVAPMIHAWLAHCGITRDDAVPAELVLWLTWADGLRAPDDAPVQRRVPRGWRVLAVDAALGVLIARQRAGAPSGAWLPIVTNHHGDHHVYVAARGAVATCYRDEPAAPSHTGAILVEYARALAWAWA